MGKEIVALDTEKSDEAAAGRRFFDMARDEVFRAFPWSFTTKFVTLGLVANNPTDEWAYSYRYPSDCLMFRRILSGVRNDSHQTRARYKIVQDSSGLLVYTDVTNAEAEYTFRQEDPARFPADFTMALSFLLAFYMAPRLTRGDPFGMGRRAFEMYIREIRRAEAMSSNEQQPDELPNSEFISQRDGDPSTTESQTS
jgi:hypothetical protein